MGVGVLEESGGEGFGLGWIGLGWKGERGDQSFKSLCLFVFGFKALLFS